MATDGDAMIQLAFGGHRLFMLGTAGHVEQGYKVLPVAFEVDCISIEMAHLGLTSCHEDVCVCRF